MSYIKNNITAAWNIFIRKWKWFRGDAKSSYANVGLNLKRIVYLLKF